MTLPCGLNELAMFNFPCPYTLSTPAAPRSSAVCSKTCLICALLKLGNFCFTRAAAPATLGAANDVPAASPLADISS